MNRKCKYHVVLGNLSTQDRIEIGSNSRNAKAHLKEFVDVSGVGKTTDAYCFVYDAKTERELSSCYYDDCLGYFYSSLELISAYKDKIVKKTKETTKND